MQALCHKRQNEEDLGSSSTCSHDGETSDVSSPANTAKRPSTAARLAQRKKRATKEELEEKMKRVEQRREVNTMPCLCKVLTLLTVHIYVMLDYFSIKYRCNYLSCPLLAKLHRNT